MIRLGNITISIIMILGLCAAAPAPERFAPPQFEGEYVMPSTTNPHPHQDIYEYLDAVVLLAALSLASYLTLKMRSRRATFVLMILSLIYFGFWRKGCVCPIGAIQNATLTVFDPAYA
ncbi:MAG: 4Fe-4S binding protein, partial [Planctomycetota bacterium]